MESNLVSYWKMDNNWNDSKGSDHLTRYGSGTAFDTGLITDSANSGLFNPSSDQGDYAVKDPYSNQPIGNSVFSVELCFKASDLSGTQIIFCMGADSGSPTAYGIYTVGNKLHAAFASSGGDIESSINLSTGVVYHVVATYAGSSGRHKLYINASSTDGGSNTYASGNLSAGKITLGVWVNLGSIHQGKIDEVSVYNTELSSDQVTDHYGRI